MVIRRVRHAAYKAALKPVARGAKRPRVSVVTAFHHGGGLKTATACAPSLEHGRFPPAFTAPKSSTSVRVILKAAGFTNDAPEAIDLAKAAIFHPELGPKSTPTGSATNFIVVKVKRDFSR